jgi:serine/threonine-protein kinase RsbW
MTNTTTAARAPAARTVAEPPAVTATCTRSFAGRPESVSAARAWVAGVLPGSPVADDVALLTSELFTNAVLHSASRLPGGIVTVSVRNGNGTVRVDVIDQGEAPPCVAALHGIGKGLEIVRQLADVFGADGCDRWFTLRTGGAS